MSGDQLIDVRPCRLFPEATALCGSTALVNVGGWSPQWVNNLNQTPQGRLVLVRVLRALLMKDISDAVLSEIEAAVQSDNPASKLTRLFTGQRTPAGCRRP